MTKESQALSVHEVSVRQRLELSCRAVSLEFVKVFHEYLRREVAESAFAELKTQDIVHGVGKNYQQDPAEWSIRGVTSATKNTLADFLTSDDEASHAFFHKLCRIRSEMIEKGEIDVNMKDLSREELIKTWFGPADFFVSHAWMKEWSKLYQAVCSPRSVNETEKEHREREKERRSYFYWLDIFAVNQHSGDREGDHIELVKMEVEKDLKGLPKVIEDAKRGLMLVFEPWNDPEVLRRAWCWQEIAAAVSNQRDVLLGFGKDSAETIDKILDSYNHKVELKSREEFQEHAQKLLKLMTTLDAKKSTCTVLDDTRRIHSKLRAIGGTSFAGANRRMKYAIALLLLNAAKLRDRAKGMNEAGTAIGLLKELSAHFSKGTKEHAELVNELSLQCSKIGDNEGAVQFGAEAEEGLTLHIDTLPVLSGKGIDDYRFDSLLLLAEIQMRICRGYCEQYEKGLVEECIQYCNDALETAEIAIVMRQDELKMEAKLAEEENTEKGRLRSVSLTEESENLKSRMRILKLQYNANYHVIRAIALYYENIKENSRDREQDVVEVAKRFEEIESIKRTLGSAFETTGEYGASYVLYAKFLDVMLREGVLHPDCKFVQGKIVQAEDCTLEGIKKHFDTGIRVQKCGYGENDPKWLMSNQSLGYLLFNHNMFEDALVHYRKALGLDDKYNVDTSVPGLLGFVKTKQCPASRPWYTFNMIIDALVGQANSGDAEFGSNAATMQENLCNFFAVISEYLDQVFGDVELCPVFAGSGSRELVALKSSCEKPIELFARIAEAPERKAEFEEAIGSLISTIDKCMQVQKGSNIQE